MQKRYIEITASASSLTRLGIYRDPETDGDPYQILAKLSARSGDRIAEFATALKRTAAELAAVFEEVTIGTDEWTAIVWQADAYDSAHGTLDAAEVE